jgi:hypothetical protein
MRDGCIVEVVRRNPLEYDENVCEELKTQEPKDKCYKFISRSQEPGGDSSLCEKIQNTEDKDTCYQEAGIRDNDVTSCERIETSGYERDYCFTNVGIGTSDTSLCERAQNPEPKDTCYKTLAKKLGDATVCNNIVNQIEKDGCNYEVARDTDRMHLELCESLQDQEYKSLCVRDVAVIEQDYNRCRTVVKDVWMNDCYTQIAVDMKDPGICNNIADQSMKDNCLRRVRGPTGFVKDMTEVTTPEE